MQPISKLIVSFSILCLLVGCTKILTYPVDYPGDQLAIIGIISPTSGIKVYVSQSLSPAGEFKEVEELYVNDATVEIYQGDQMIGMLTYMGNGLYRDVAGLSIEAGKDYHIVVIHEVLGNAKSEPVVVPNPLQQLEVDFEFTGKTRPSNEPEAKLTYRLKDEPGPTYYLTIVKPDLPTAYQFQITDIFGTQNFEFCEITNYHPPLGIFMSDVCFEDRIKELGILIGVSGEARLPSGDRQPYSSIHVEIASISYEFYQYLLDKKSLETDIGILEPRPTFNNIDGGVGVVMATNEAIRKVRF